MKLRGENPASMRSTVPDIRCAKDLEYVAARWHSVFPVPQMSAQDQSIMFVSFPYRCLLVRVLDCSARSTLGASRSEA